MVQMTRISKTTRSDRGRTTRLRKAAQRAPRSVVCFHFANGLPAFLQEADESNIEAESNSLHLFKEACKNATSAWRSAAQTEEGSQGLSFWDTPSDAAVSWKYAWTQLAAAQDLNSKLSTSSPDLTFTLADSISQLEITDGKWKASLSDAAKFREILHHAQNVFALTGFKKSEIESLRAQIDASQSRMNEMEERRSHLKSLIARRGPTESTTILGMFKGERMHQVIKELHTQLQSRETHWSSLIQDEITKARHWNESLSSPLNICWTEHTMSEIYKCAGRSQSKDETVIEDLRYEISNFKTKFSDQWRFCDPEDTHESPHARLAYYKMAEAWLNTDGQAPFDMDRFQIYQIHLTVSDMKKVEQC